MSVLIHFPITVLSASIGEASATPFPTDDQTADYLLVTDRRGTAIPGWRTHVTKPCTDNPRRVSRRPKMQPWRCCDSEWVIWIDARVRLKLTAAEAMQSCLDANPHADLWACRHRCRKDIYDEAARLVTRPGAFTEDDWGPRLIAQVRHYAACHWAAPIGLYELGFMAWRINSRSMAFGKEWRAQYATGCERDQMSFPVAVYNSGVALGTIPGSIARNDIFEVKT